jgi:hypothetical protein
LTGSDRVLKEEDLPTFGKEFFNTFLHTDYTIKRRKGMSMESSDMPLADMVGRWAYFQDIAMQGGAEIAFGKIMGVRNTNQWMGNKYFLSNNVSTSMHEISNATAYFMPFNMPSQFDFTESETIICSEYLNTYCTYLKDGVMKKGKVYSFNEKEINIRSTDGDKDTILFENRLTEILEHADEVEDLVMAITIITNKG